MLFMTDSLWRMANTGPSASTVRCLSVTIVAISMMRSESGLRPVISRSIQMRFSDDFIAAAAKEAMVTEHHEAHGTRGGDGVVIASFGRGALVESAGATLQCGLNSRKLRV